MPKNINERLDTLEQLIREQNIFQKEMLNPEETARYLNVSRSYLYKMTSRRMIPHYCPNGKKLFFKRTELDQWMQANRKKTRNEVETAAVGYTLKNTKP